MSHVSYSCYLSVNVRQTNNVVLLPACIYMVCCKLDLADHIRTVYLKVGEAEVKPSFDVF